MKNLKQSEIKEAAQILKNGGLIAFPTETVFGLGVIFDNENSYKRLIQVKRRPPEKPFTVMCADLDQISGFAELNDLSKRLIKKFMPGQFTLITKAKANLPSWCVSKEGTVGLRIPDSELIRSLIREVGKPLLVPSANKSGEAPAINNIEAETIFKDKIDAIIEGESNSKIPSTIVLVLDNDFKVIREGIITPEEIKKELEKWKSH